jgi:hypothetical protein
MFMSNVTIDGNSSHPSGLLIKGVHSVSRRGFGISRMRQPAEGTRII